MEGSHFTSNLSLFLGKLSIEQIVAYLYLIYRVDITIPQTDESCSSLDSKGSFMAHVASILEVHVVVGPYSSCVIV